MLTGMGTNERFLKESYLKDRRKALEDKTKYTDEELREREVTQPGQGGGRTNPDTYEIWQDPVVYDPSIRSKKKIDIRDLPWIGH